MGRITLSYDDYTLIEYSNVCNEVMNGVDSLLQHTNDVAIGDLTDGNYESHIYNQALEDFVNEFKRIYFDNQQGIRCCEMVRGSLVKR